MTVLFFVKIYGFICTVDFYFSRFFHFIVVLFYELQFLKNYVTYPK
jgi:hypothetical protein